MDRYADQARHVAENLEVGEHTPTERSYFNILRRLDSRTEDRLQDEGYLEEYRGAETVSRGDWKDRRRDAVDTQLFDFLLYDSMEAHLVFYREYNGYSDDEEFIDDVLMKGVGAGSEDNVVETYNWLDEDVDAPENLENLQSGIDQW
ncbi:hypothetical protein ACM16X_02485 [Haloarcula japonica]|uniref:hypothetical protein n=1 Tax=Haloarcula japonica TaxID=29282 RepID=UPI0039F6DB05